MCDTEKSRRGWRIDGASLEAGSGGAGGDNGACVRNRRSEGVTSGGKIFVDSEGVVRCCGGGHRMEGVEVIGEVPRCGGKVKVRLAYPVLTDEDGRVDGVDMTVAENRRRFHNEVAGITESDEKELKGRMSSQPQHNAFVLDRGKKDGGGKRWKHGGKWEEPLDPTAVHDTPKFPVGSVMVERGVKGG